MISLKGSFYIYLSIPSKLDSMSVFILIVSDLDNYKQEIESSYYLDKFLKFVNNC